jgi:hypothetical protein
MAIGQLEPLYRWLKSKGTGNPVSNLLKDIETLAKSKYVTSQGDGILRVTSNTGIEAKLSELQGEQPMSHHCSYQAIGKKMYINLSRINLFVSKTALSLVINENDTVDVDWLEYDAIFGRELLGQTLWNSISTVVVAEDGTTKRGFVRVETKLVADDGGNTLALRADFKLSRSSPFYILIDNCMAATPTAVFGATAKSAFERMESEWRA